MNWQLVSAMVSAACALFGSMAGVMRWARLQAKEAAEQKSRLEYLMLAVSDLHDELKTLQQEVAHLQPGLMRQTILQEHDHVIS